MQNCTFLVLLRPIFGEEMKTAPPKEIGCQNREVDVVTRPEKAIEFPILAEKSVSISVKTFFLEITWFWAKKAFEFPTFLCDSDSRTMKIRVKVVCSFLTLSKKPLPFSNLGYAPDITSKLSKHIRVNKNLFAWVLTVVVHSNLRYWQVS